MPEKEAATVGKTVAADGSSTSQNGAHPQYSTDPVNLIHPNQPDYLQDAAKHLITPEQLKAEQSQALAEAALLSQGAHDEGNAQCLRLRYPGRFLHNSAFGWVQNAGSHWTQGGAEAALDRAIVDTLSARIEAALKSGAADKHAELIRRSIPSASKVQGAKYLFESLAYESPYTFDTEPDLLNCPNGVVNLRTGELSEHTAGHRFTHCTTVGFEPGADPTKWVQWLEGAVGADTAAWLQLAVGYTLTGHTREEVLFYLFGPPRSGKGTFTETLLALFGSPLAKEVNFGTFTAQRTGDSQNFDLAPLKPCRMVAASESNAYERFNEAKIKALTGGNEIYCAFKHHTHFSYRPQFKIWLSSNEPVNADPDDQAVWGRLRVIEFPHSHLDAEDKLLKEQMRSPEVLPGVLVWAVQGAVQWYKLGRAGLKEPASSKQLKQRQRDALDAVGMWIEECCELGSQHYTASSELYGSYADWCKINGVEPKKMKGLVTALERKGHKSARLRQNDKLVRGLYGLRL